MAVEQLTIYITQKPTRKAAMGFGQEKLGLINVRDSLGRGHQDLKYYLISHNKYQSNENEPS